MMEPSLKCNFPKCHVVITGIASATRCSHIFCKTHIIESGLHSRCPVCSKILDGDYDVFHVNVNPPEEWKTVLYGQSPETIIEFMSKGLEFWSFQQHMQAMHYKVGADYVRGQLARKIHNLETLKLDIKHYIQIQDKKVKDLKDEIASHMNAKMELQDQLTEKKRQLDNLQLKYEGLRRESVASMMTRDTEPIEMDCSQFNNARMPIFKQPAPATPKFVFQPHTPRNNSRSCASIHSTPRPRPDTAGSNFRNLF